MNLKFNIFFSIFMIGLGLTSCVDENIIPNNSTTQGDTQYFVKLRLKTQSENFTRAGESDDKFVDGTHEEHAISPNAGNIALFFDEKDNYISYSNLYSVNETAVGNGNTWEPEAIYSCRFYGFANREPAKVLVVVNANNNTSDGVSNIYSQLADFPGWTLDEVMKNIWEEKGDLEYDGDTGTYYYKKDPMGRMGFYKEKVNNEEVIYFTMSNSTYMEETKGGYELHCAEPIAGHFTTNGEDLTNLTPVTIYLERMVSKFTMEEISFDYNKYIPISAQALDVCEYQENKTIPTYKEYKWGIQILGWGMNGLETRNYIFKNVPPDPTKVEQSEDGEEYHIDNWIKYYNSPATKRCYWAEDPHYEKDESPTGGIYYPWQFDEARDHYDLNNQHYYSHFHSYDKTLGHKEEFALTFYPFTHFCKDVKENGEVYDEYSENSDNLSYTYTLPKEPLYTPENTFKPGFTVDRSRGSRAYELAGTHVLVGARMLIDKGNGIAPHEGHIYRNRVGVVYLDEVSMFEDFMNAINQKLESQTYMYFKYYPWDYEEVSAFHKNHYGHDMRAKVGGKYTLYYEAPDNPGKYYELTSERLRALAERKDIRLIREADAINGDGKVIPWIMYNKKYTEEEDHYDDYEPWNLYILEKTGETEKEGIDKSEMESRRLEFMYWNGTKWIDYNDGQDDKGYGRDENDVQSLFYEIWGVADDYNHGLMYYAIPVYAPYQGKPQVEDGASLKPDANPEFKNNEELKYYYGVIRNNWYKFNLHSINEIGIPVSNPTKPIVPNYHNKKSQTKVDMEILQWHVEDQTIIIN